MTAPTREELAAKIVRDCCELPDRSSPDDEPELLLVTCEELSLVVLRNLEEAYPLPAAEGERAELAAFFRETAELHNFDLHHIALNADEARAKLRRAAFLLRLDALLEPAKPAAEGERARISSLNGVLVPPTPTTTATA